jgi:hypothetical protein
MWFRSRRRPKRGLWPWRRRTRSLSEDLVALVREVGIGETNLFVDERRIVLNDPGLAGAVFQGAC